MPGVSNRMPFFWSVLLSLLVLATLVACSDTTPPPTPLPTLAPPTATPLPRGGIVRVRMAADLPNLRPWQPRSRDEELLTEMLYSGLVQLDQQLAPQPDLAEAWQASPDGRLITMTMRSNLTWHDGQPLTSADASYTIQALRSISPTTALLSDMQRIAEVSTPTSTTLVLSLTERYAPIFSLLTVPILPRHLLIDKEIATLDFWSVPIGSGPFQLAERQPGTAVRLTRFDQFYGGAALLDGLTFQVVRDPAQAATALQQGELELAELPWAVASRVVTTTIQAGGYPENGYVYLALNVRSGRILNDARVRQALAATIDLPVLVQLSTNGQGIPIANSAAPGSWADQVAVPTTTLDLAKARSLLDEAGWKLQSGARIRQQNDRELTLQLIVRQDDQRRVAAAEQIARSAAQAGFNITIQRVDFETGVKPRYAPPYDFDLLLGSWSNGVGDPAFADYRYYDPDDFALFHSSQINQGVADLRPVLNSTGFQDAAYDTAATIARQVYTLADRQKALADAQQRVADLRPYIFLWADTMPVLASARLQTLDGPLMLDTPNYMWAIERWYLQPGP